MTQKLIWLSMLIAGLLVTKANAQTNRIRITLDVLDKITLASREEGFIVQSQARSGSPVSKDEIVVELDTKEIELELEKAILDLQSLEVIATNDSEVRATAAKRGSALEYTTRLNQLSSRYRAPELEKIRARLEFDEYDAQWSGTKMNLLKSKLECRSKEAEVRLLKLRIQNTKMRSPFTGRVADVFKFKGDFVSKGEDIAVIYRLDKLAGVALINMESFNPATAVGRIVELRWGNGGAQQAVIERALPRVDAADMYSVFFKVHNSRNEESGQWDLLPGMTISGTLAPNGEQKQTPGDQ